MDLQRASQEYAWLTFSVDPASNPVDATVDFETWAPVTVVNSTTGKVLLRGPDCAAADGLLVSSRETLWVRVTNVPEYVIRSAGIIELY